MQIEEQEVLQIHFFFLFDVAITNAYILLKSSGSCPFKDFNPL